MSAIPENLMLFGGLGGRESGFVRARWGRFGGSGDVELVLKLKISTRAGKNSKVIDVLVRHFC